MSSSRSAKRKRYNEIKNNVVEEVYDLVLASGKSHDEITAANEDFVSFYKSMSDRQSEMLSQWIGINEKYGAINDLIKGNKKPRVGESSHTMFYLPTSYMGESRKFLDHSYTSLKTHAIQFNNTVEEMIKEFQKSGEVWKKKLSDLKEQGEELLQQNMELRIQVGDLNRHISG